MCRCPASLRAREPQEVMTLAPVVPPPLEGKEKAKVMETEREKEREVFLVLVLVMTLAQKMMTLTQKMMSQEMTQLTVALIPTEGFP